MRCGENGADCALKHVVPALGGTCTKTRKGVPCEWACRCPVCHAAGKLTLTAQGRNLLRYCHRCNAAQETLTAALSAILPCFWPPGARPPRQPKPTAQSVLAEVQELALSGLPPMSMKLSMLEMCGMSTSEALEKLGVRRDHYARVIAGRTGGSPKRARMARPTGRD